MMRRSGEIDGRHFLSMEFIKGEELSSLLRRIGRLPQDKAIQLARQICALAISVALVVYGFYNSLAGQPLFGGRLLQD